MADIQAVRFLNSAIATLERAIVPELARDESKIALDLVIRILHLLSARFSTQEQGLQTLLAHSRKLLDLLNNAPVVSATKSATKSATDASDTPLQRLEAECQQVEAALALIIPTLVADAANDDAAGKNAAHALQSIIDDQRNYLAHQDPDILQGVAVVYRGGRIDRQNRPVQPSDNNAIDETSLTAYLRNKFPHDADVIATDVKVLTGGFSKTTVLFTRQIAGAAPERLVLRRDLRVPFMNKSVLDEFSLLQRLYRAGIKVAEPRWVESDPSHFGGGFLISRCVAGSADVAQWRAQSNAAQQVSHGLAELLAQLHTLDVAAIGTSAQTQKSAGDALTEEIDFWNRMYAQWRAQHYPLIDIPLAWVKQNIPRHLFDQPARVVHGDVGFHNLMVADGQITALLDWEFAHCGDPGEDLAFARLFLEQISGWDQFLEHYRARGGLPYSEQSEKFYRVWTSTRNTIGTMDAMSRFQNAPPAEAELKNAVAGYILGPYLQLDSSALVMQLLSQARSA